MIRSIPFENVSFDDISRTVKMFRLDFDGKTTENFIARVQRVRRIFTRINSATRRQWRLDGGTFRPFKLKDIRILFMTPDGIICFRIREPLTVYSILQITLRNNWFWNFKRAAILDIISIQINSYR